MKIDALKLNKLRNIISFLENHFEPFQYFFYRGNNINNVLNNLSEKVIFFCLSLKNKC